MHANVEHTPETPAGPVFPTLPIVTPDPPRRSESAKYGGLFYLGLGGLLILVTLVSWFAYGVWSLRSAWAEIYVLHDASRPEPERNQAAYALSRDPRINQRQLWDMCLRRTLPDLSRYILAEALTADAATDDPRAFGVAVARSEGWPDWLRLLLTRPIAYAAAQGSPVAREPLVELTRNADPAIVLWARFALAASPDGDAPAAADLQREAARPGPNQQLAQFLLQALEARYETRIAFLDQATLWLRAHHPEAARLWKDWTVRDGRLVPKAAPPTS
jgi:hypothetical protein